MHKAFVTRSAILASVLAVAASLVSFLTGHTGQEAIIKQSRAAEL